MKSIYCMCVTSRLMLYVAPRVRYWFGMPFQLSTLYGSVLWTSWHIVRILVVHTGRYVLDAQWLREWNARLRSLRLSPPQLASGYARTKVVRSEAVHRLTIV